LCRHGGKDAYFRRGRESSTARRSTTACASDRAACSGTRAADTSRGRHGYGRAYRGEASRCGARARSVALGVLVDRLQERHLRRSQPRMERANAVFPNPAVELGDEQLNRSLVSRRIGRYAVTHLKMPAVTVELIGHRAVGLGLGNHLKLMWQ